MKPDDAEYLVKTFIWVAAQKGGVEADFEGDDEGNQFAIPVMVLEDPAKEPRPAFFHMDLEDIDADRLKVYYVPEDNVIPLEYYLTPAEVFESELVSVFLQSPDEEHYFTAWGLDTCGITRESHTFTVIWQEGDTEQRAAHTWEELTFPDGSTLFVVGEEPYLSLPGHLQAQREASLAKKDQKAAAQPKAAPDLMAKLMGTPTAGQYRN